MARILVVDDEPDARFLLRYAFERAGHEVTEAGDGVAALKAVQECRPALVVTDMMMPMMGGVELIKRLRATPDTAQIPILSVSGNLELAVDADVALNKFGDLGDLIRVAEELLDEKRGAR
jgi:CheY-like chemotaxis protein